MLKPEQKIAMFKVILSAEAQGNERMQLKDVADGDFNEFLKHRVATSMCEQLLEMLNDDELMEKRYVIAQGIHQHISQEGSSIKQIIEILNHIPEMYKYFSSDMLDDTEDGEEDV